MNDNVISLKSKKPLVQTQAEETKSIEQAKADSIAAHLSSLDKIRGMVAAGRLEGMIVLGRDTETGLFLTEVIFPYGSMPPQEAIAYVGMLEMMKLDISEIASMAPTLMTDGKVLDPFKEFPEDEEDE